MSQHIFTDKGTFVLLGYDRALDYVFDVIERNGETVYCKLDDDNAGIDLQDVNYFRPIIAEHGITLPEGCSKASKLTGANALEIRLSSIRKKETNELN